MSLVPPENSYRSETADKVGKRGGIGVKTNIELPGRIPLANLPTPVHRLENISRKLGAELFLKRDDMTGSEAAGNKLRKLEFVVHEALAEGAKALITCGGIQSNHARATAVVARRLGLDCHLVLRGRPEGTWNGNLLLDRLLGATFTFIPEDEFAEGHREAMEEAGRRSLSQGRKAFLIPMGASNPTGTFGYAAAYEEILRQEAGLEAPFDVMACAVGSGGTYAGLSLGNILHGCRHRILGVPVCDSGAVFTPIVNDLVMTCLDRLSAGSSMPGFLPEFIDGHAGRGYALNTPEEMDFISEIAVSEGVILDPVYTAKAFMGLLSEMKAGRLPDARRVLFVHTGGIFGLFPKAAEFQF